MSPVLAEVQRSSSADFFPGAFQVVFATRVNLRSGLAGGEPCEMTFTVLRWSMDVGKLWRCQFGCSCSFIRSFTPKLWSLDDAGRLTLPSDFPIPGDTLYEGGVGFLLRGFEGGVVSGGDLVDGVLAEMSEVGVEVLMGLGVKDGGLCCSLLVLLLSVDNGDSGGSGGVVSGTVAGSD